MNKQAIFNVIATHLLTQNERSGPHGACLYRADERASGPKRCAIGILIPDDKYSSRLENSGVGNIEIQKAIQEIVGESPPFLGESAVFLGSLQAIHDNEDVSDWRDMLETFADCEQLKMPNPEIGTYQYLWLAYLRSGTFKQTHGYLHLLSPEPVAGYCCLGIAQEKVCGLKPIGEMKTDVGIAATFSHGGPNVLHRAIVDKLKMFGSNGQFATRRLGLFSLAEMNDVRQYTFEQIADYIEGNPRNVFSEPA